MQSAFLKLGKRVGLDSAIMTPGLQDQQYSDNDAAFDFNLEVIAGTWEPGLANTPRMKKYKNIVTTDSAYEPI